MIKEDIIERLTDTTKSLRQTVYLSFVFSLLVLYLLFEGVQSLSPQATKLQADLRVHLAVLEEPLALNKILLDKPFIVRNYLLRLEPLTVIESAAEQAIVGAGSHDPRWLSLDPVDRDLARSLQDSLGLFVSELQSRQDTDLFDFPIHNIPNFLSGYVWPERKLSSANAIRIIEASARVATQLGQLIPKNYSIPPSVYFYDYLESSGNAEVSELISKIRSSSTFGNITNTIGVLETFCSDNKIDYCSYKQIKDRLDSGKLSLEEKELAEKIEISFFPGAIAKQVIINLVPLLLVGSVYLQISHYYRRLKIISGLQEQAEWHEGREHSWLMTNTQVFGQLPKVFSTAFSAVMVTLVCICLLAPLVCQAVVAFNSIVGLFEQRSHWLWGVVHVSVFFLTAPAILRMLYDELTITILK